MLRDEATILDMIRACRLVLAFGDGMDEMSFSSDLKTQSAILHQLLVLGEAVKRLSDEFRLAHPEMPWRTIAGMRDNLIHEYDAVDIAEVWKTSTTDIPPLIAALELLKTETQHFE
jgi:uncharacterized protein with HEPN domain